MYIAKLVINAVVVQYNGAWMVFLSVEGDSSGFGIKVGLYQGSVLSFFLFVIVMEVITNELLLDYQFAMFALIQYQTVTDRQMDGRLCYS